MFRTVRISFLMTTLLLSGVIVKGDVPGELKIQEIRKMGEEELLSSPEIEVVGQVVRFHSRDRGLFLFDGEDGIYAYPKKSWPRNIKLGSWVRINGNAEQGIYNPIVMSNDAYVEKADDVLQYAESFDPNLFYDPSVDCQWVSSSGVIIDYDAFPGRDHIMLQIEMFGYQASIQIPYSAENLEAASELMFKFVTFQGVACVQVNDRKQMIGRLFYLSSIDELKVEQALDHIEPTVISKEEFINGSSSDENYISLDGTITYIENKNVYLQEGIHSLKVRTKNRLDMKVGDRVRVFGYAWSQPISRGLRATEFNKLDEAEFVEPIELDHSQLRDPENNYTLVTLDVEVMDIGRSFKGNEKGSATQTSFLCRAGEEVFECKIPTHYIVNKKFSPGMRLEVTGIVNLEQAIDVPWRFSIERMWLQLRYLGDIKIISEAPWMSTTRLYYIVAIMIGIIFISLFIVGVLRRTVYRQTELIGSQIKRETLMSERHRIARELHDNLDQSLAGIALQLSSSIKLMDRDTSKGVKGLKRIQEMLVYCSEESRNTILELRGGWLEEMDVLSAIKKYATQLIEQYNINIEFTGDSESIRFDRYAERQVFSIAKESMINACKHAEAKVIKVEFKNDDDGLILNVADDGIGFAEDESEFSGRFGILGMRERANRIHAVLDFKSQVNGGSCVELRLSKDQIIEVSDEQN